MAIGLGSIFSLIRHERQRDLNNWQITLGIMADSKANRILAWVDAQYAALNELARNGALQLYTQQLLERGPDAAATEPAQLSYLRNLIRATAERTGFIDQERLAPPVPANVAFEADAALILFDRDRKIITATPGAPEPSPLLLDKLSEAMAKGPTLYDIALDKGRRPVVGFVVPVFALQRQGERQEPVGVLVGLKNVQKTLYPLFAADDAATATDEALLVRQEGEEVVYLSPLADGTPPLKRRLAVNAPDLAAAFALLHPGAFAEKHDYAGSRVLVTSRNLAGLPWVLIQKISVDEALRESKTHQRFLFIALLLVLLLVGALLVAAWWHGSTVRERRAAQELRRKSQLLEAQTHLLNAINDNISDFIFLADSAARLIFVNSVLAKGLGVPAVDLAGKGLANVFGPDTARHLEPHLRQVLVDGSLKSLSLVLPIAARTYHFHVAFIPLPYRSAENDAVLVSLHDVTLLEQAQRKQTELMHQVVRALMRAIDLHDPYSANHSAKTTKIAAAVGRAMQIAPDELTTLEIAADLCNLGKLSMPKELLAKTEELTAEEQKTLRQEPLFAEDILSGIDFDGPVLQTIVQKHEHLDGSGYPRGLSGEAIIKTARILAVANAFVAMISPRAYRDKLEVQDALSQLMREADKKFDRHVVAALYHVAENEIDWTTWEEGR